MERRNEGGREREGGRETGKEGGGRRGGLSPALFRCGADVLSVCSLRFYDILMNYVG